MHHSRKEKGLTQILMSLEFSLQISRTHQQETPQLTTALYWLQTNIHIRTISHYIWHFCCNLNKMHVAGFTHQNNLSLVYVCTTYSESRHLDEVYQPTTKASQCLVVQTLIQTQFIGLVGQSINNLLVYTLQNDTLLDPHTTKVSSCCLYFMRSLNDFFTLDLRNRILGGQQFVLLIKMNK